MMQDDHSMMEPPTTTTLFSSSETTPMMNREFYIQYYTQKLQRMALERQNQALSQMEQLFQHEPHLVAEMIHSEMVQAFLNPTHPSSLMIVPSLKCLKTLIVILTTIHILIQRQQEPSSSSEQLLNQEQALLQYFISSGCRNNMEMYQWLKGIQQAMMNMLGLHNLEQPNQQQQQALYWYQSLERYFDLILFPELNEEYINNYVRPSTSLTNSGISPNQSEEKKAFVFLLFEFVDAIHTILKVRK
ncbi:hypothetical protein FDP41_003376 [Naegleria fowleri]|uniref:Uncharacterized protein n=1 Tax=Naegleria fowleri TaxID=5763 RepID=A0A6A5BT36_NAEFO|nr:uncharacterized protein FDP41_003376 [Naegleria fowleri]KAF0977384.1 hypothetical protein FDP41_003376 [Naegleria fowleri]CAG4713823.1 unnamed protein product [Naegleria fowleri]